MTRGLIQEILDKVAADLPQFKKVALYNNDFDLQDEGSASPFYFPALFVSFPESVTYNDTGSGNQTTNDFRVRLYIADKFNTDTTVLNIFDLKQEVYKVFHKWQPSNATSFMRIEENTDESRTNYYVFSQDYTTSLRDSDKNIINDRVEVQVTELEINKDVKIDPNTVDGIRTDKPIER